MQIIEPLCAVFRRRLKGEGQKYTPERAQILDAIIRLDGVFEVEVLLAAIKNQGLRVSKATVYRTVKLLADAGIIQQVHFDGEQSHYQLAYGRKPQALLVRVDTREVTSVEIPEIAQIRERLCAERGLVAEGHRLIIYANAKR